MLLVYGKRKHLVEGRTVGYTNAMATQSSGKVKKTPTKKASKSTTVKSAPTRAKVDYYPNRMSLVIAALAVCVLLLLAVVVVYL
jgi:hypothetical protein